MKRILPIFLVPFFSFAEGEYHSLSRQEFIDTVNRINTTVNSVENVLTYEANHLENVVNTQWASIEQYYWNSNNQETKEILRDVRRWIIQPLQSDSLSIHQEALRLSEIQTNLLALAYTPIPDYVPWLDAVTNQLERLCDLQDLTDDHVMTNTAVMAANFNAAQTTLDAILSILQQMTGGSSGGGGSSDYPDYTSQLNTIISTLSSISSSVASSAAKVNALYDLLTDADGIFQKYYNLAYDRLEKPDAMLSTDLSRMWEYTIAQMSNVVNRAEDFSLSQQVSPVLSSVDGINLHLSNEGLINLEQLAFQQRQYLCSLEMLNVMRGQTNGSDVAWITNYLGTIQQPFYKLFDLYLGTFFQPSIDETRYGYITNVFSSSPRSITELNTAFRRFHNGITNTFYRLELELLALNGVFSTDDLMTDQAETMLDEENVTRNIDYTTNSVIDIQANYANVSNTLSQIMASFKELTDAFDIAGGPDAFANIRILPSFTLGGIQIEHIDLVYADYAFIADGCRYVFTCIWYLIFGIIGFKMVLAVIFLFGRTIAHVVLIVSTLLN